MAETQAGTLEHAATDPRAARVAAFWREAGPDRWFTKDDAFDAAFRDAFLDLHFAAARRELDDWMQAPESAFALLVLLDQFPRNCFRGTGHMYATDPLARMFARRAVDAGFDRAFEPLLRVFFYLPFTHSEDLEDQERCVALNRASCPMYEKHAVGHRDIIRRFGRFPHRNPILGRETTPEEQAFLDAGGFAG